MRSYDHTQRSPVGAILLLAAALEVLLALRFGPPPIRLALLGVAVVLVALAASFWHLRVREEADALRVGFGPLALFERRIRYDDVLSFRRARSTLLDGWGIHWFPGRGWTWNLWGRDCVEIETRRGGLRVGTDDAAGLARHLERRCRGASA